MAQHIVDLASVPAQTQRSGFVENVTITSLTIDGKEYPITKCPPGVAQGAVDGMYEITVNTHRRHLTHQWRLFTGDCAEDGRPKYNVVRTRSGTVLWYQEQVVYYREMRHSIGAMIEELGYSRLVPTHVPKGKKRIWLDDFGPDAALYADRKEYGPKRKQKHEPHRSVGCTWYQVEKVGQAEQHLVVLPILRGEGTDTGLAIPFRCGRCNWRWSLFQLRVEAAKAKARGTSAAKEAGAGGLGTEGAGDGEAFEADQTSD